LFDDVDERLLVECAAVEPALDGRVGCAEAEVLALRRAERSTTLRLSFQMTATLPSTASM
jgi:hypothetical protein